MRTGGRLEGLLVLRGLRGLRSERSGRAKNPRPRQLRVGGQTLLQGFDATLNFVPSYRSCEPLFKLLFGGSLLLEQAQDRGSAPRPPCLRRSGTHFANPEHGRKPLKRINPFYPKAKALGLYGLTSKPRL